MKREIISRNIKLFGGYFFILLSPLELINLILILTTNFKINDSSILLINLILKTDYGFLFSFVVWLMLIMLIIFFLIIGYYLIAFSKNELDTIMYSKQIFLIGAVFIVLTFIKMEMVYIIESGWILLDGEIINFERALQDFNYMPIFSYYMWRFLTVSDCYRITVAMVMVGFGLYWFSLQEKEITSQNP
ncbi:MAG: hypothetical protein GF329_14025 [Candidatus Lokiarchaeota archaeon]|nr:hypothetical protein [Candidatus Lokiarchaeota archaeon]